MSTRSAPVRPRRGLTRLGRALSAVGVLLVMAVLVALVIDRIFFPSSRSPGGAGSGVAATQSRSLAPFSGVDLVGANNVIVRVGARQSVVVHADSNLLKRVTTQVRSGALVISTTPGNLSAKAPMFVTVSLPSLHGVRLQGNGNISVTGIHDRSLTVALPGSGNIDVTGTTTRLDVTVSGAGNAQLRQLVARDANAALSGHGTIMLTATRSLTARLSGTGTIVYGGNPRHVTQTVHGTGTISAA